MSPKKERQKIGCTKVEVSKDILIKSNKWSKKLGRRKRNKRVKNIYIKRVKIWNNKNICIIRCSKIVSSKIVASIYIFKKKG